MTYLRNSILATIIYYDILDYPLTPLEVYKYLINPVRVARVNGGVGEIDLGIIFDELDKLAGSKILGEKNGFYFLDRRDSLYDLRIQRNKIADQKWKKFLRFVRFLALAPYLRGVFASGSMAINNTDEKSDFDILIIIQSGRLYTCRLFLWLISSLMGARRKPYEKIAPDKLCFNHYITDGNLCLIHQSLFNAQTYINLKPVMIKSELVDKFYSANLWLNNYAYNFKPQKEFVRRSVKMPSAFKFFAGSVELILDSFWGDNLEKLSKYIQQRKVKNNPITYVSGGRVVWTDQELEFHPHSFEKVVLERYNKVLKQFGVVSSMEERDSGLIE